MALTVLGILIHSRRRDDGQNHAENRISDSGKVSGSMKNRSPDTITLVAGMLLAISGFVPLLVLGGTLSGFPLIMHMAVAPFFVVCLSWSVIVRIHRRRFVLNDWLLIKHSQAANREEIMLGREFRQKLFFWSFLVISVLVIVSILMSMYPLVSSEGLGYLIAIHGYSSLLLVVLGIIYLYLKH